jgi:L-lactate dehydrogenase complex protein LldG
VARQEEIMSRESMLSTIKKAVGEAQKTIEIPRKYRPETGEQNLLPLLEERISDYRANVRVTNDIRGTITEILERLNITKIAIPNDLPETWLPDHLEILKDHPNLEARELETVQAVMTGSKLAIAETGTIVLDHGANQGRRVLTLIPDIHICVVFENDIVDNLPAAMLKLGSSVQAGKPITFISGPSATSDIELIRVEGVHGPRMLEVILVPSGLTSDG